MLDSGPECSRNASQTSLNPMLWVSCAKSNDNDVAPGTEGAHLLIHSRLPGQLGHQELGNEIANLPQEIEL